MMERVTLFYLKAEGITIEMQLYFTEKEELFFDGYDIGKSVEDAWGDSDYEYTYTIAPEEVKKLYMLLEVQQDDKTALLNAIKSRFHTNSAYSEFGSFMNEHSIAYQSFTWS
jgi:hypothetical protein